MGTESEQPDIEIEKAIRCCEQGGTLHSSDIDRVMSCVMAGQMSRDMLTRWLGAMALRIPTSQELLGCVSAFMRSAIRVPTATAPERIMDTCGTGGAHKVFNVSTLSALVIATAGCPVAKHGNRSRTGFGSSETLAAMGLPIDSPPQTQARMLDERGFCFCLAPKHHQGAAHAVAVRKALAVPTIFNVVGPLTNPAGALRRVLGVWDKQLLMPVAETLAGLGAVEAMVVHSVDGLDEISVCAPTWFVHVKRGTIVDEGQLRPEDFGVPQHSELPVAAVGLPNAVEIAEGLLRGQQAGPRRDMLLVNSAVGFVMGGQQLSWKDAAAAARDLLDSRRVLTFFRSLVA